MSRARRPSRAAIERAAMPLLSIHPELIAKVLTAVILRAPLREISKRVKEALGAPRWNAIETSVRDEVYTTVCALVCGFDPDMPLLPQTKYGIPDYWASPSFEPNCPLFVTTVDSPALRSADLHARRFGFPGVLVYLLEEKRSRVWETITATAPARARLGLFPLPLAAMAITSIAVRDNLEGVHDLVTDVEMEQINRGVTSHVYTALAALAVLGPDEAVRGADWLASDLAALGDPDLKIPTGFIFQRSCFYPALAAIAEAFALRFVGAGEDLRILPPQSNARRS